MTVLEIRSLSGGYGEADILSGIDMTVAAGEIVTIAGTNGSGKSTLVKAIMGLLPRVSGDVLFKGRTLLATPIERRIAMGIGYVPQVRNVFGTLTILENLQVVQCVEDRERRIREMLDLFPALAQRRAARAENLSGGERQQLALARALMSAPQLILLDEPSAALSPALTEQVFAEVRKLPALGVAVLLVEQRARQALAFSDRGYILDSGRIVLTDTGANLLRNDQMAELYIGRGAAATPRGQTGSSKPSP